MEIDLGAGRWLRSYSYGWILCKRGEDTEDGKASWYDERYFGGLSGAIAAAIEYGLRESDARSLGALEDTLQRMKGKLMDHFELRIRE